MCHTVVATRSFLKWTATRLNNLFNHDMPNDILQNTLSIVIFIWPYSTKNNIVWGRGMGAAFPLGRGKGAVIACVFAYIMHVHKYTVTWTCAATCGVNADNFYFYSQLLHFYSQSWNLCHGSLRLHFISLALDPSFLAWYCLHQHLPLNYVWVFSSCCLLWEPQS